MIKMSKKEAEAFYAAHRERSFFDSLISFMTSAPCIAMVLEGDNAISRNREIMGATNPKDAAKGTLRARFGKDVERNAVHGSDSPESALLEIASFFKEEEIFSS